MRGERGQNPLGTERVAGLAFFFIYVQSVLLYGLDEVGSVILVSYMCNQVQKIV